MVCPLNAPTNAPRCAPATSASVSGGLRSMAATCWASSMPSDSRVCWSLRRQPRERRPAPGQAPGGTAPPGKPAGGIRAAARDCGAAGVSCGPRELQPSKLSEAPAWMGRFWAARTAREAGGRLINAIRLSPASEELPGCRPAAALLDSPAALRAAQASLEPRLGSSHDTSQFSASITVTITCSWCTINR